MRPQEKTEAWLWALQQSAATVRLDPAGFSRYLREHDVMASVGKLSPRPLLLIHCRGDQVVPYQLSEKLFAAAGEPKELWLLDGGSHGSAQHDPELQSRVVDWLEAVLSSASPLDCPDRSL
jgi:fermentation-respiration switch protein FrsA (DUF1100 family)